MSLIAVPKAKCRTMINDKNIAAEFKSNEDNNSYVVKYKSIEVKGVGTLTFFIDYMNRELKDVKL